MLALFSGSPPKFSACSMEWDARGKLNGYPLIFTSYPLVSSPDPTYERARVWWHPADSLGFINVDYFLERNFSPPITLQRTQSAVQHRKFLATSSRWHSTFLARKLVLNCATASYKFLMKPEESAGCHQTLSSRAGSGGRAYLPMYTGTSPAKGHLWNMDTWLIRTLTESQFYINTTPEIRTPHWSGQLLWSQRCPY